MRLLLVNEKHTKPYAGPRLVFECVLELNRMYYLTDEPETRDSWWREIRTEIRSHAKALGCHAVVGYSESTTIW